MFPELNHPMCDGALRIAQKFPGLDRAQSQEDEQDAVQAVTVARFFRAVEFVADDFNVVFHV